MTIGKHDDEMLLHCHCEYLVVARVYLEEQD